MLLINLFLGMVILINKKIKKRADCAFFCYNSFCLKGGAKMEEKLTKEEVLHVAHLARIYISEEEIEKYQIELKKLLNDVDKIKEVTNFDEDFMISPVDHLASLHQDIVNNQIDFEEVKNNVPRTNGNLIEVPVMINE